MIENGAVPKMAQLRVFYLVMDARTVRPYRVTPTRLWLVVLTRCRSIRG